MKRFITGLIAGLLLAVPVSAFAWTQRQAAQPIYGVACESKQLSEEQRACNHVVSVFDDGNNKCYVVANSQASYYNSPAISCLKR